LRLVRLKSLNFIESLADKVGRTHGKKERASEFF